MKSQRALAARPKLAEPFDVSLVEEECSLTMTEAFEAPSDPMANSEFEYYSGMAAEALAHCGCIDDAVRGFRVRESRPNAIKWMSAIGMVRERRALT